MNDGAGTASLTAFASFSSSVDGGTKVTVSDHGNVVAFESPLGYEHIGAGGIYEGYVLCYQPAGSGAVQSYDVASSETGLGTPTAASKTATTANIVRRTGDGVLELQQKFTFKGADRRLLVQMTVKNLSGFDVTNVRLRRTVDLDVDSGGTHGWAGFSSWHARTTRDSVSAWSDPASAPAGKEAHGMTLRAIKGDARQAAVLGAYVTSLTDCAPAGEATPVQGDRTESLDFDLGTLRSGRTGTVKVDYLRT